jgi:hypothetical protein
VLEKNHLSIKPVHESGVGDFTMLAGWSYTSYTTCADFVDASLQTGVLFPTGRKKNLCEVFSVPLGYNGHYAVPLIADAAFGMLNWLNFGLHAEALFFFDRTQTTRIRTNPHQDGFIRLDTAKARVKEGNLWSISAYVKADHFTHGASYLFGYSFDHQSRTCITPCSKAINQKIANGDPMLREWNMGVLHALVEYDWCNEDNQYGPRVNLQYNYVLHGKNVYRTSMLAGMIGLDMVWEF